jgi:hypothetical protein
LTVVEKIARQFVICVDPDHETGKDLWFGHDNRWKLNCSPVGAVGGGVSDGLFEVSGATTGAGCGVGGEIRALAGNASSKLAPAQAPSRNVQTLDPAIGLILRLYYLVKQPLRIPLKRHVVRGVQNQWEA